MANDQVKSNLEGMDDLDFTGWNNADWNGVFADHHTEDVLVDWKGQPPTYGHTGAHRRDEGLRRLRWRNPASDHVSSDFIWIWKSGTCVIGEFEGGGRMVTVAKWVDGAIAEEYIWS